MSRVTMWRSRWRCIIKPAYSFSFLLSINIFVWQNVLYFLDAPRMLQDDTRSLQYQFKRDMLRKEIWCSYIVHCCSIFLLPDKVSWTYLYPFRNCSIDAEPVITDHLYVAHIYKRIRNRSPFWETDSLYLLKNSFGFFTGTLVIFSGTF